MARWRPVAGVDPCHGLKGPITRHGEYTRAGQHHRADAGGHADDGEDGDDVAGDKTKEPLGDGVGQSAGFNHRDVGQRHRVEVQHVEADIDGNDRRGPEPERNRHVPSGVANLFGDVRRRVHPE